MVLVFATSDKGGTGRSVTSCNLAYRKACEGSDVCYVDFDFGSPTAGAIFEIGGIETGVQRDGTHSYLQRRSAEPVRHNVWTASDRTALDRPDGAGQLVLLPGDRGGGEFAKTDGVVQRCTELFLRLDEEFDVCLVDLSAGRSYAIEAALEATGRPEMRAVRTRWVVYHRWTKQHIVAASDLVFGERGLLKTGVTCGHDEGLLRDSIRFVRTAVLDANTSEVGEFRPAQAAWLRDCNRDLQELAARLSLGRSVVLGQTPMDPVLQWREQLITDTDVDLTHIANTATLDAFKQLATRLTADSAWESL
jgi:hypothetical protein